MKLKYNIFSLLLILMGFVSCQNEIDVMQPEGGLLVKLNHVSTSTISRATPAEIGTPTAERFALKVVDNASAMTKYDDKLTDQLIRLAGGEYTVTASCGENPIAGIDAPYYIGTKQVTVVQNEVTEASLTCKVSNALISVIFGANESDRTRLDKFYKSCGVRVKVGDYAVELPRTAPDMSAYFRAGSTPELEFYGVLKANDQQVSTILTTPNDGILPHPFQAADHAIITLTLPNPESATVLDISKVELMEASMEETIPLSWLPIPQATAEHKYDDKGDLVGTDITFTNCYPGMEWKAVVTDAKGTEYRSITGTGEQKTTYTDNTTGWPYIPAGNYTATYYLIVNGEAQKTGSRDFRVENPNIQLTLSGYTSYTKYQEGDIDGANACDAGTIYAPGAKMNISPSLLENSKYTHSIIATMDGTTQNVPQTNNQIVLGNQTSKAARKEPYRWNVSLTFDKVSVNQTQDFYITGLPYTAEPPTQSDWSGSANSWRNDYVRLHGQTITKTFHLPADINVDVAQNVYVRRGTVATTYNLQVSSNNLCTIEPAYNTNETNQKTYPTVMRASDATVKCVNSYGNPDSFVQGTHAKIYKITVLYR